MFIKCKSVCLYTNLLEWILLELINLNQKSEISLVVQMFFLLTHEYRNLLLSDKNLLTNDIIYIIWILSVLEQQPLAFPEAANTTR